MHELGIISNIFKTLEKLAEQNELVKISKVKLKLGQMRQIVPEMMEFAFEITAKGTLAEGAKLEIEEIPIQMKCKTCTYEFKVMEKEYICPKCEHTILDTISGKEVILETIEGEK